MITAIRKAFLIERELYDVAWVGFSGVAIEDGNRRTDIPTIVIAVTDPDGFVHKTLLTWRQAREYADAILTLTNLAEFG